VHLIKDEIIAHEKASYSIKALEMEKERTIEPEKKIPSIA